MMILVSDIQLFLSHLLMGQCPRRRKVSAVSDLCSAGFFSIRKSSLSSLSGDHFSPIGAQLRMSFPKPELQSQWL